MKNYIVKPYKKSSDFVKSPFRYPGGKFYALKHILPFLDAVNHDEFREPFVGGGSIFYGKNKVAHNWINDIESDIINVYNHLSDDINFDAFSVLFDNEVVNRERYSEIVQLQTNNDFERAFRTFYLNRTSYSGIINKPAWGYAEGKSSPPPNWKKFLQDSNKKLKGVKITNLDFEEVINAKADGKEVLIYLDPPYYNADQKRAYKKPFEVSDHIRLKDTLKKTKFKFCLSYDDCTEVRELYAWANIHEKSWLYNTANINGSSRNMGNELIITNYDVII